MENTISKKNAIELKPKSLSPVERELRMPPPRPYVWIAKKNAYRKFTEKDKESLIYHLPLKAWVIQYENETDIECSHHFIAYAYEYEEQFFQSKIYRTYDEYQLNYCYPEYSSWIYDAFRKGGTFTLLVDPENPVKHNIFGEMHLYVKKNLLDISKLMQESDNKKDISNLAEQFLRILFSPLGKLNNDWKDYYQMMEKLGLLKDGEVRNLEDNLHLIEEIILIKKYNNDYLVKLSKICQQYSPGIWAAR